MSNNPWEADLDIDEDTGEVILPPGYTGRSGNPRAQAAARSRGVGQVAPGLAPGLTKPQAPPDEFRRDEAAQQAEREKAASGGSVTPVPSDTYTPPTAPYGPLRPGGCPPCGTGVPGGRMRSPDGFPLGLIIGLSTIGGVLWYTGRMAALGETNEDLDDILDALPSAMPQLAAHNDDEVLEGEVVDEAVEGQDGPMTVELRNSAHDPRDNYGDRTGGWGSTRTSVVRPASNPQQVAVTEVNRPEFYNQANDMQPSRVDPRYGLLNTQPAILTPDKMSMYRWPTEGNYRGMVPQPFSWESEQMDGLNEITQGQRDEYQRLVERAGELATIMAQMRRTARTTEEIGELALIEGQLEAAQSVLTEANDADDQMLSMMLTEVDIELEQVAERLRAYEAHGAPQEASAYPKGALVVGLGVAAIAAFWFLGRERARGL